MILNNLIPPKGFLALNFYGILFVRKDRYNAIYENGEMHKIIKMRNHEDIHTSQMRDFCKLLVIGGTIFYLIYFFEYLFKLFKYKFDSMKSYRSISFEVEAYMHETDLDYLQTRKKFSQWKTS